LLETFLLSDNSPRVGVTVTGEAGSVDPNLALIPGYPGQVDTTQGAPSPLPLQRHPPHYQEERVHCIQSV